MIYARVAKTLLSEEGVLLYQLVCGRPDFHTQFCFCNQPYGTFLSLPTFNYIPRNQRSCLANQFLIWCLIDAVIINLWWHKLPLLTLSLTVWRTRVTVMTYEYKSSWQHTWTNVLWAPFFLVLKLRGMHGSLLLK